MMIPYLEHVACMGRKKKKAVPRVERVSASKKRREKLERRKVIHAKRQDEHVQSSTSTSYSVEDYMTKVEEFLDSFQPDMAIKFCERALQLGPNNLYVLDTIAPLLLEAGESDRALELFQRAVSLSPGEGHTKYLYLGQMSHGQEAIGYLTKGIEVLTRGGRADGGGPGSDEHREQLSSAYCALAEVYLTDTCFESDSGQRCYECCCKAVELSPSNPEGHQLTASCLLSQQLPDRAREALMKGLSLWLPSCRGDGREEGAMARQESDCFPSYSSRVGVAKLLLELEEHNLAFEVLEGLLREDDEVVGVWYLMGWLHCLIKDADSARFYLEQTKSLYIKLCCDEEELLTHATELLTELGPSTEEGEESETDHTPSDMDDS